ncbi:hypothetical protein B0T09DRAFT_178756 [Sordaria sp. MPI-SDFR-AT-0083]|nr:hypothetical protein B0T09DRAFT_178756 [Sordaria sp. MPI-SDFR-AT-0083]
MCSGRKVNPYSPNAYDASLSRHYRNRLRVIHMLTSKNPRRNQQMGNCWKHLKHRPLSRSRSRRITTHSSLATRVCSQGARPHVRLLCSNRGASQLSHPAKKERKRPKDIDQNQPSNSTLYTTMHWTYGCPVVGGGCLAPSTRPSVFLCSARVVVRRSSQPPDRPPLAPTAPFRPSHYFFFERERERRGVILSFLLSFPLCYRFRHILAARPLGDSITSVGPRLRYGQHMIYIGNRPRFALGLMVLVDN